MRAFDCDSVKRCEAALVPFIAVLQCYGNASLEIVAIKRFGQKTGGTPRERLMTYLITWKGCDENNRYIVSTRSQIVQQLESTHLGHLNI